MRIFDENGNELQTYDKETGYVKSDTLLIAHHEAVEAVAEIGHWETLREYPNGGKDVDWIVDTPAVEARDAWDEYENILRYIPYTVDELAAIDKEKRKAQEEAELQERIRALPDTAVTWDELAAALSEGVNSI